MYTDYILSLGAGSGSRTDLYRHYEYQPSSQASGTSLVDANLARRRYASGWVSHDSRQSPAGPSGAHRGERMGWGRVLQRCCTRLLTLSGGLYFTYGPRPVLP